MPGIVKGEASSCANPLLPFFYQEQGIMKDIYSLRYEVFSSAGSKVYFKTVDVKPCSEGGFKKGTGYYVADFAPYIAGAEPEDPPVLNLSAGVYDMVFYFKVTATSDELAALYRFEVLDSKYFRLGSRFASYVGSDLEALSGYPVEERQKALEAASRMVEALTGRFFFPKYMTIRHSVRPESRALWLDQPIIGINAMSIELSDPYSYGPTEYEINTANMRIFNRHLEGLLSPDDRQNPKIQLVSSYSNDEDLAYEIFPVGCKSLIISGAFGYTDPDGSPWGEVPRLLQDVVISLADRRLQDPTGADPVLQNANRIKMAKTRDQQIQFDTSGTSAGGGTGANMTGDARLDDILASFCRPWHVGVAG